MKKQLATKMRILELSEANKVTGRRYVKFIIHEIYDSPDKYNKNGISWKEQYVMDNINSANGMPLCVEFLDYDRSEPFGHGMSGIEDNEALFEYSTVVGVINNAYVDTVTLPVQQDDDDDNASTDHDSDLEEEEGSSEDNLDNPPDDDNEDLENQPRTIRALIGEGYIFEQRYPKFVQWLKSERYDNEKVEGSVEIGVKKGYEAIVYESGWREKGRVPQIYDYTGYAILGIEPSDDSAVLLELNNLSKKKEDTEMEKDKVILDLNSKIEAKTTEINSLQNAVSAKDKEIEVKVSEINSLNEKVTELEKAVADGAKEKETMVSELNELRKFKTEQEGKELVSELNSKLVSFTDEEKAVAKDKIEAFNAQPSKDAIGTILSEINSAIAQKVLEARKAKPADKAEDVVSGDMYEINSEIKGKDTSFDDIY